MAPLYGMLASPAIRLGCRSSWSFLQHTTTALWPKLLNATLEQKGLSILITGLTIIHSVL